MLEQIAKSMADTVKNAVKETEIRIRKEYDEKLSEIEARIEVMYGELKSLPAPKDGTSVTVEDVEPLISEAVQKAVEAIPAPKDGTSVTVEDVEPLIVSTVTDRLKMVLDNIPVPENGKDALDIEILPCIDVEKSYERGTYATHEGGLWRSYQRTNGLKGWECIVRGRAKTEIEYDGQRSVTVKIFESDGSVTEEKIHIPAILGKGVWSEGQYEKGDVVQLSGSSWQCMVEKTTQRPGTNSDDWLCAAKRGGTGESAYDTARKAGFKGSKSDWLESLGKKHAVKVD